MSEYWEDVVMRQANGQLSKHKQGVKAEARLHPERFTPQQLRMLNRKKFTRKGNKNCKEVMLHAVEARKKMMEDPVKREELLEKYRRGARRHNAIKSEAADWIAKLKKLCDDKYLQGYPEIVYANVHRHSDDELVDLILDIKKIYAKIQLFPATQEQFDKLKATPEGAAFLAQFEFVIAP